jgi:proteasome lid subunit RPN8/RPN11
MEGRERGFVVCKGPHGYSKGPASVGTKSSVSVTVACPMGSRPVAIQHNHPGGDPSPSAQDYRTVRQFNIPYICVRAKGRTRCYPARRDRGA